MVGVLLATNDFMGLVEDVSQPEDLAFPHGGRGHAYTGPGADVYSLYVPVLGGKLWNSERAGIRSKADNELIIDNSVPGEFLINFKMPGMTKSGVYAYFEEICKLTKLNAGIEGDKVWAHTSRKFIRSLYGRVSTSVCGADRTRIFYKVELPYMMVVIPELLRKLQKTKDIETINLYPAKIFRSSFSMSDFEKAYRLICLTEQRKTLRTALDTGSMEAFADCLDTVEMYQLDQFLRGAKTKHPLATLPPDERLAWKKAQMDIFANEVLKGIDTTLSIRPKTIVVVKGLPSSMPKGPK